MQKPTVKDAVTQRFAQATAQLDWRGFSQTAWALRKRFATAQPRVAVKCLAEAEKLVELTNPPPTPKVDVEAELAKVRRLVADDAA